MHEQAIEQWLHDAVINERYRNFSDLHVNEIDPKYENPSTWLVGLEAAFDAAVRLRDQKMWDFTVAAAIPVASSQVPQGMTWDNLTDLESAMDDMMPPSLYVFPRGREPWVVQPEPYLPCSLKFPRMNRDARCYFVERFDEEDNEYWRIVWIAL